MRTLRSLRARIARNTPYGFAAPNTLRATVLNLAVFLAALLAVLLA